MAQVVFERPKEMKSAINVRVSFESALSLIDPAEVNQYIRDYIENYYSGPYITYSGSSEIGSAGTLAIAPIITLKENMFIRIPLRYTTASKSVRLEHDSELFSINSGSIGGYLGYYLELENSNAVFFSAGPEFYTMGFEKKQATATGFRVEFGYSIFGFRTDWEVILFYNNANGKAKSEDVNIDLSGPGIGIRLAL